VDSKLDDNEIRLGEAEDKDDNGVYEVIEGVDFELAFGNEVTLFVKKDKVLGLTIESDFFLDAIEVDGDELTLEDEDEDYDISDDVTVWLNGKDNKGKISDGKYSYAKVVVDDDDEVIFIDAYDFAFIVVEEVEDEIIFGYGDELDAEDYVFVKNGKKIALEDLEEGDIVFYNSKAEFAEVFNKSYVGEIEKVFENKDDQDLCTIRVDGKDIKVVGRTKYLDGDELEAFTINEAEDMMDEGEDVEVFVDRFGDAVYVVGDTGAADTSKFYALVLKNSKAFASRGKNMWTLDVLSETGKKLSYDIDDDDATDDEFFVNENEDGIDGTWSTGDWDAGQESDIVVKGSVVQIEVDEDGEVESVKLLGVADSNYTYGSDEYFKTDASYVAGFKLQDSAVVFDVEDDLEGDSDDDDYYKPTNIAGDDDDIEVTTLGDLKYNKIYTAAVYADSKDRVCVIVVTSSDREGDTTKYDAVAVGNASKVAGEFTYRVKLNVEGKEDTYYTKEFKKAQPDIAGIKKGDFLVVEIDDDTNEIVDVDVNPTGRVEKNVTIADLSVSSATFKVGSKTYRLADAEILDADYDPIRVSNLSNGDKVNVFMVSSTSNYVSILVVVDEAADAGDDEPGDIEFSYNAGVLTVTGLVYDEDGDNEYFIKVSGDAASLAFYIDGDPAVTPGVTSVDFDVSSVTPKAVYKVELFNAADPDTVLATKNMLLP
jgi:hypothetical protein